MPLSADNHPLKSPASGGKHLLFIDEQLNVGGVAVLISRVSRLLLRDGWRVTLLVRVAVPGAKAMLPEGLVLHELGLRFKRMYFPGYAVRLARNLRFDGVDLVYATGVVASWLGTMLSTFLPKHPRLLCAAYTQREYCYPRSRSFAHFGDVLRCENFDRNVPDVSKVFQSEVVRDNHSRSFGRDLRESSIAVVPVDREMMQSRTRRPDRHRIVSLGRLVAIKSYNLYMIEVVARLRAKGHPVRWDVYGTGALQGEMRHRVGQAGMGDHIKLHGYLEDDQIPVALAEAGAFVGQGTALIEAAFCRVPSVVGILGSKTEETYGYLYELPFGTFGEELEGRSTRTTTELLERLLLLSEAEYQAEMDKTRRYVQPFALEEVYQQLLGCFKKAQPCKASYWRFAAYNLHGIYRKLRRSTR